MTLLTVGELARLGRVSRTSLLYYERMRLLQPVARSAAGYRLYGPREVERLRAIRLYREAGMPVDAVRRLLAAEPSASAGVLGQRLLDLDRQVQQLRAQQHLLARLLAQPATLRQGRIGTKRQWVELLRAAGFSETDMLAWHRAFEAEAPHEHQRFLAALGMAAAEIERVRAGSLAAGS